MVCVLGEGGPSENNGDLGVPECGKCLFQIIVVVAENKEQVRSKGR